MHEEGECKLLERRLDAWGMRFCVWHGAGAGSLLQCVWPGMRMAKRLLGPTSKAGQLRLCTRHWPRKGLRCCAVLRDFARHRAAITHGIPKFCSRPHNESLSCSLCPHNESLSCSRHRGPLTPPAALAAV